MRWLITGGCGFIGTNLIAALRREQPDSAIRVLDDLSESERGELASLGPFEEVAAGAPQPPPGAVQLVVGDVRERNVVSRAAQGSDVFVHLAARTGVQPSLEDPRGDCATNVLGTLECLEAARSAGCRSFVFASSGAPLGDQVPPLDETRLPHPLSPYGASKLAGEAYCQAYAASFGLMTAVLRFSNVYGPRCGRKGSVVARFVRRALAGQPLEINGDGTQSRDFIYVDDVARAIVAAARPDRAGEVFQIGSARETTVAALARTLATVLSEHAGVAVSVHHGPPLRGEVRRSVADTAKARRILGWRPEIELQDGLRRTVDWFAGRQGEEEGRPG
ncbi:MAG: NAD-dependent epimerase/dehydratase family protein [Deltaproteobacteria bacterium]|nr:NAD-dependent epimerase/dehydratase family protein [Deltaproteobacteria bacterium]